LGRDDAVRTQLRSALEELGAVLVHEGELRGANAASVTAHEPAVVLLNLDSDGEDGLDGLDELLLDPSMHVVFNEAETTASLTGWDLARWARHLASKVLGHDRTIPPPPEGAEGPAVNELIPLPGAPPSPESLATPLSMATLREEASAVLVEVPASRAPVAGPPLPVTNNVDEGLADLTIDAHAIEAAMQASQAAAEVERRGPATDSTSLEPEFVASQGSAGIDQDELDAALAIIDAGDGLGDSDGLEDAGRFAQSATDDVDSLIAELDTADALTLDADDLESSIGASMDAATADDAIAPLTFSLDPGEGQESLELDEDVAALAAQLDALEAAVPAKPEVSVRDPDFFFALDASADSSIPKVASPTRTSPPASAVPSVNLSLADELVEVQAGVPPPRPAAPAIDISYLSLEALPDPGLLVVKDKPKHVEEPYLPRPGIDLMLAPLDAPVEPVARADEKRSAHAAVEADLGSESGDGGDAGASLARSLSALSLEPAFEVAEAPASGKVAIPRVLVLGASIGGPDALRTFLAGLPADFPALLVLAQHLESGFFDRLAQQLQKISKLPVRVANVDTPACVGEVVVIPSGTRVKISPDGKVRREDYPGPTHYRPCIDDVMRDIADAFGKRATAIIFSGMAGDAVEGAVYLTSKGGEVWAQTPESCVVSSMVDGAQARGVVEFVGSPRELADHCVARYGDGG